jgi:uncharacterized SAM-binding protein YcdF (DUF218 family)
VRRLLLAVAVLVAAWVVLCLVLFVWPPAQTGPPRHADAVIMLSGDHRRLPTAEELVRKGIAPVLALSSVGKSAGWTAAEELCRAGRYAGALVVCFEADPYSTRGEAETVSRLAGARGWHSLVVVSSTYHLTRASLLFHRCFAGSLHFVGAGSSWWQLPLNWASETAKLAVQLVYERGC